MGGFVFDDHSRVKLRETRHDYINASMVSPAHCIHRSYIVAQGPLAETTYDFWQMVWEQNSYAVIMLCKTCEKNQAKCHQYFPSEPDDSTTSVELNAQAQPQITTKHFTVSLTEETRTDHYTHRELLLTNTQSGAVRQVLHFQFTTWPDFGEPETTDAFLSFLLAIRRRDCLNIHRHGPPVVHCSAGVGRSGVFVLIDSALLIIQRCMEVAAESCQLRNLDDLLVFMRQQRMGLIQTPNQLRFAWRAVVEALQHSDVAGKWEELMRLTCDTDSERQLKRSHGTDDSDDGEPMTPLKTPKQSSSYLNGMNSAGDATEESEKSRSGESEYSLRQRLRQEKRDATQKQIDDIKRRKDEKSSIFSFRSSLVAIAIAAISVGGLLVYRYLH